MKKVLTLIAAAAVTVTSMGASASDFSLDGDGFVFQNKGWVRWGPSASADADMQIVGVSQDSQGNTKCTVEVKINVDRFASSRAGRNRFDVKPTVNCPASYISTPTSFDVKYHWGEPMTQYQNGQVKQDVTKAELQGLLTLLSSNSSYLGTQHPLSCGNAVYTWVHASNGLFEEPGNGLVESQRRGHCWS